MDWGLSMADIVNGLFGLSSQQIRENQRQQDMQTGLLLSKSTSTRKQPAFNVGYQIGSAFGRGLTSKLDPELQRAVGLEKILQETQQQLGQDAGQDPANLYSTLAKNLADAGYTNEAMIASQKFSEATKEKQILGLKERQVAVDEQAQKYKESQVKAEKLPPIEVLYNRKQEALTSGNTELAKTIQNVIDKETYIAEKAMPTDEATRTSIAMFNKPLNQLNQTEMQSVNEQLQQNKLKASAVQGTGSAVVNSSGKEVGTYTDKGDFRGADGVVIPNKQMSEFRDAHNSAKDLLNIFSSIDATTIDNAFGHVDATQNPVLQAVTSPDTLKAQYTVNELGVTKLLTNLQSLKGASSDREMSKLGSTFPGFLAPPKVMKSWLANASATTADYVNRNAAKYGFDSAPVNLDEVMYSPLVQSLPDNEREKIVKKLSRWDSNFTKLSEKQKVDKLNLYMGNIPKSVNVKGKSYTKPANWTDEQWLQYLRSN